MNVSDEQKNIGSISLQSFVRKQHDVNIGEPGYLNKPEREIIYEPIEEITECMEESTEEMPDGNDFVEVRVTEYNDEIENSEKNQITVKDDNYKQHFENNIPEIQA